MNPLAYGRRTLGAAAALSAVPAVAAAIDQQSARTLHSHAVNMYSAHDVPVDPGLLYLIVYAVAGSLVVLWLTAAVTAWVSRRVASGVGALLGHVSQMAGDSAKCEVRIPPAVWLRKELGSDHDQLSAWRSSL